MGLDVLMTSLKQLALQAADDTFKETVGRAVMNLTYSWAAARNDKDRDEAKAHYLNGLVIAKAVHALSVEGINDQFGETT